jgi:hypothetical protein
MNFSEAQKISQRIKAGVAPSKGEAALTDRIKSV